MDEFDKKLQELELEEEKYQRCVFSALEREKRPLILYGAGGNCEFAMYTCSLMKASVECVCDSKATGLYNYANQRYMIISKEILLERYKESYVLITSWKYENEIYDTLSECGFPKENLFFLRNPHRITMEEFCQNYAAGYRWAYNLFKDADSRRRIMDKIRLLLFGVPCSADSLYKDGYLGYPKVSVETGEVYVDGGAYIGDTVEEFIAYAIKSQKQYKHIYAFEPDENNIKRAISNLQQYKNISVVPAGLWGKTTTLNFLSKNNGDFIGSYLSENKNENTITVPVVSLDEFFSDKAQDTWPTIIKMDIEGAEKEALLGAAKIIATKKPKLIICAYHKPEDIYELPQTILSIRSDYQLEFWQIGESFWDIILYAI